ncbi:MAG: class I SAM-dependent methyltransferase [Candidatus Micrarchaeota archaeon]
MILPKQKRENKNKLTSWSDYYSDRIDCFGGPDEYLKQKRVASNFLFRYVRKHAPIGSKIVEAGCGSSINSVILNRQGYEVTAIDNDPGILEIAKSLNRYFSGRVNYANVSLFDLPYKNDYFELAFSHGVLEHFEPAQIAQMINECLRVAKRCVFSVPTFFCRSSTLRGDENLWTYSKWREIIKHTNGHLEEVGSSFIRLPFGGFLDSIFNGSLYHISPILVMIISRKNEKR